MLPGFAADLSLALCILIVRLEDDNLLLPSRLGSH